MTFPPYLKKGDTIGIVAPAGFMAVEKMQACVEALDTWGFTIELGATTHSSSATYFSGTDEERLADLQYMLDSHHIKAILCARGGYGLSRIIDRLDFKRFKKHPKWIIGYSDITVLHAHLYARFKIASLHAPMAAAFNDGQADTIYIRSVCDAIKGAGADYAVAAHSLNITGDAEGELVGGNLSLLVHLTGTASDIKTKNRILFLEDVGEYLYSTDRMFVQLRRSGKLEKLAGLIIGGFTDAKDTDRPFGKTVYELIHDHIKDYDYPVCFGFPVSHTNENYALKVGGSFRLQVRQDGVQLKELPQEHHGHS